MIEVEIMITMLIVFYVIFYAEKKLSEKKFPLDKGSEKKVL